MALKVLVTFPGRAGDLLWALPSIRALSRRLDQPIDLAICGEFAGMVPLLERQPYLGRVYAVPDWSMSAGWTCPAIAGEKPIYDHVLDLGYRRWPELPLPYETLHTLNIQWKTPALFTVEDLDLATPWITHLPKRLGSMITAGWSECHFELKLGVTVLLDQTFPGRLQVLTHDRRTRWYQDKPTGTYAIHSGPWVEQAGEIATSQVFLGCNSGLHVLAVAVGTPVVLYEPMVARHNPIFFPLGWDGPQVTRVVGNDGDWTTDVRHTADTLRKVLGR